MPLKNYDGRRLTFHLFAVVALCQLGMAIIFEETDLILSVLLGLVAITIAGFTILEDKLPSKKKIQEKKTE